MADNLKNLNTLLKELHKGIESTTVRLDILQNMLSSFGDSSYGQNLLKDRVRETNNELGRQVKLLQSLANIRTGKAGGVIERPTIHQGTPEPKLLPALAGNLFSLSTEDKKAVDELLQSWKRIAAIKNEISKTPLFLGPGKESVAEMLQQWEYVEQRIAATKNELIRLGPQQKSEQLLLEPGQQKPEQLLLGSGEETTAEMLRQWIRIETAGKQTYEVLLRGSNRFTEEFIKNTDEQTKATIRNEETKRGSARETLQEALRLREILEDEQRARQSGRGTMKGGGIKEGETETEIIEKGFSTEAIKKHYQQVEKEAAKYGMTLDNLKNVHADVLGQKTFTFKGIDESTRAISTLTLRTNKWGEVLTDTQRRFRSFGASVARNIQEVFKWAIAAQLVWLPMRELQNIMGEMIELQTRLATTAVATGKAYDEMGQIFSDSFQVAQETGTTITGVLEGFEFAYRTAGKASNEFERMNQAQVLLTDAMILSKLASIDEKKALDALSGSLNQLKMPLTEGRKLVDSWVRVSRQAAVSIDTLSESFAITAATAQNVGVYTDDLNGYIAVLAENTTLSATEIGNAMRAIISGYQSDKAISTLEDMGFTVRNVKGEVLDFNTVIQQVYSAMGSGELSTPELSKLTLDWGGGTRRAGQVTTLIENLGRAMQVSEESSQASGEAANALDTQLAAIQTTINRLGNSFKRFAQTLGQEGGMLDLIEKTATATGVLLDFFSELTELMGSSLPVIGAFGIAMSRSMITGTASDKLYAGGAFIPDLLYGKRKQTQTLMGAGYTPAQVSQKYGEGEVPFRDFLGRTAPGLGIAGLSAIGSFSQGKNKAGIGQLIGGGGSALLAAKLGASGGIVTLAAAAGTALASAFVEAVWGYEYEFAAIFKKALEDSLIPKPGSKRETLTEIDRLEETIKTQAGLDVLGGELFGWFQEIGRKGANLIRGARGEEKLTTDRSEIILDRFASSEQREQLEKLYTNMELERGDVETPEVQALKEENLERYKFTLVSLTKDMENLKNEHIITGEISAKKFKDLEQTLGSFGATAATWLGVAGDEIIEFSERADTASEALKVLFDLLYYAKEGQIEQVLGLVGSYQQAESEEERAQYREAIGRQVGALETQSYGTRAQTQFPQILDMSEYTGKEVQLAVDIGMEEVTEQFRAAQKAGLVDEGLTINDYKRMIDPYLVVLKDGTKMVIRGATVDALKQGFEEGIASGRIQDALESLGISDYFDFTQEEVLSAASQADIIGKQLEAALGYTPDLETTLILTKDGIMKMEINQTLTNLILRDIQETQEKQLEGIYNLPTDASFYVPFTGYALGQGGGGGLSGSDLLAALQNMIDMTEPIEESGEQEIRDRDDTWWGQYIQGITAESIDPFSSAVGKVTEGLLILKGVIDDVAFRETPQEVIDAAKEYEPPKTMPKDEIQKGTPYGVPQPYQGGGMLQQFFDLLFKDGSFLDALLGGMGSFTPQQTPYMTRLNPTQDLMSNQVPDLLASLKQLITTAANRRIGIEVTSNTHLYLDGRIIANSVKQYISEDILGQQLASGDVTKQVVL